jgi:hypothetical protein
MAAFCQTDNSTATTYRLEALRNSTYSRIKDLNTSPVLTAEKTYRLKADRGPFREKLR